MNLKYFKIDFNKTISELFLKSQWRRIAVTTHPDKGGSHEAYLAAYAEYETLQKYIGRSFGPDKVEDYDNWDLFFANIHPAVKECFLFAYSLPGVTEVEICGTWVYITTQDLTTIKTLEKKSIQGKRFFYGNKKAKWIWALVKYNSGKPKSMEAIRTIWGSRRKVKDTETTEERLAIAA